MKKVVIAFTLALMAIGLMVGVATYAQGPDTPPREPGAGEISTSGLNVPPGPGQIALYMFTGVATTNQNAISPTIATAIFCTNISTANKVANVEVEIVDRDGQLYSASQFIFPGQTVTFSTLNTTVYDEIDSIPAFGAIINTGNNDINQGSGRVLATATDDFSTQLICNVKIVDPVNNPPRFEARLPLYTGSGNLIDGINLNRLYLPLIFK